MTINLTRTPGGSRIIDPNDSYDWPAMVRVVNEEVATLTAERDRLRSLLQTTDMRQPEWQPGVGDLDPKIAACQCTTCRRNRAEAAARYAKVDMVTMHRPCPACGRPCVWRGVPDLQQATVWDVRCVTCPPVEEVA